MLLQRMHVLPRDAGNKKNSSRNTYTCITSVTTSRADTYSTRTYKVVNRAEVANAIVAVLPF